MMIKEYTKQVIHNAVAHHPPTIAQPIPKQQSRPNQLPPAYILCHMVWNIPLASWDQLSWLCSLLPWLLVHPAEHGELKKSLTSTSTTQQQLRHQRVTNITLILNPKHSTVPATRRKINSVPAETRTVGACVFAFACSSASAPMRVSVCVAKCISMCACSCVCVHVHLCR